MSLMTVAKMLLLLLLLSIVACGVVMGSPANASGFNALYVFGDSLLDPGNRHLLKPSAMGLPFPIIDALHLPYGRDFPTHQPTGRFSDGLICSDVLASYMGLPYPPAYLKDTSDVLQGCSFATSGAKITNKTSSFQFPRLNFAEQVGLFAAARRELDSKLGAAEASAAVSRSLFMTCLGANDLMSDYILNIRQRRTVSRQDFYQSLITIYSGLLQELYRLGGRKFAVGSLPPLGCIPALRAVLGIAGPSYWQCLQSVNEVVQGFNSALQAMMGALQASLPDARFVYLNSYDATLGAIDDPAAYGLLFGLRPCCGFNEERVVPSCFRGLNAVCLFAGQHVFWDFAHPTQAFNQVLARLFWEGPSPHVFPTNLQRLATL